MNISYLQTFVTVARLKSFSKAAEQLKLTQPAVSFQIHSLEKEYQEVFFDRSCQSVKLTEAGEIFLKYAQKIVEANEELRAELGELKNLIRGRLEIGASNIPGEYILPGLLGEFKKRYPDVEVKLSIYDSKEVISLLLAHEINIAFCGADVKSVPIVFEQFADDELVIAMHESHHLTSKTKLKLKDLLKNPIILREEGSGTRKVFLEALQAAGYCEKDLNITLELGSTQAVLSAVASGLGIAPVSIYALKNNFAPKSVVYRRVSELDLRRPLYIAYNEKSPFSKAIQAFLEIVREKKREYEVVIGI